MADQRFELKLASTDQVLRGLSASEVHALLEAGIASPECQIRPLDEQGTWQPLHRWAAIHGSEPPRVQRVRADQIPTAPIPRRLRDGSTEDPDKIELELTPMIDVVFQLLIFFMLTGYFATAPRAELPRATAGDATSIEGKIVLDLVPDGPTSDQVLVWMDDKAEPVSVDRLADALRERMSETGLSEVLVRADRQVRIADLRRVLAAAGQAGATATVIGVQGQRQ